MPLNAQVSLSMIVHESSSTDLSQTLRATPVSYALSMADGSGANQAQVSWSSSGSATTTPTDLDLSSLPDTRGGAAVTVSFTAVKAVFVRNKSASQALNIGGPAGATASAAFPPVAYPIAPGGCYCVVAPTEAGLAVSPSGARIARLAAASGSAEYDVVFVGEGSVA
jgi:hypothetical protein